MSEGRRLAVGDWVRLVGPHPSVPGPGKIIDGEHDPADGALLRAHVEFARTMAWFTPANLVRFLPHEEAAFCERALNSVKLPSKRAAQLRAALDAFVGGQELQRSPGLLDRLWTYLPANPKQSRSGLVKFFDEAPETVPPLSPEPPAEIAASAPAERAPPAVRSRPMRQLRRRPKRHFDVPELPGDAALAAWLGLTVSDLDWFADVKGWLVRTPIEPLRHYRYHWLPKANGSKRLIEAPKELLRELQRRILHHLLARVPPHDAAHGFRRGRSVVTFAAPHCGKALVLRMDLRDFFPSVGAARVTAMFRAVGYPDSVARLLTGLVTTRTPDSVLEEAGLDPMCEDALRRRHLPQGAPTSPALSNLCAFGLDVRLSAAATRVGATYTRYADDLALSGGEDFRGQAARFRLLVCRIAAEEGFTVRWEKNRWMPPGVRQRLGGLVVNERPRPARAEFDRLKAILNNCVKRGPREENRDGVADFKAHLRGRVGWFEHVDPARGARLRAAFERVAW